MTGKTDAVQQQAVVPEDTALQVEPSAEVSLQPSDPYFDRQKRKRKSAEGVRYDPMVHAYSQKKGGSSYDF